MPAKTPYFNSREEAGQLLADKLANYRYEDTIVLALNEGGVIVGAEIARRLHALIAMLLTKDIFLPDGRTIVGVANEAGGFIYNDAFSTGELEELQGEYHESIEQSKMQAIHDLHVALGQGGIISKEYFRNRVVIVVSDSAFTGLAYKMAADFLKTVKVKKVVMVAPIASVQAVDILHVAADDVEFLQVFEFPFEVNHYYENHDLPEHNAILNILNDIILNWHPETKPAQQAASPAKPLT